MYNSLTLPCQYPDCEKRGFWRRQNTAYQDNKSNYCCLCNQHADENDEYWDEMWKEYYYSVLP